MKPVLEGFTKISAVIICREFSPFALGSSRFCLIHPLYFWGIPKMKIQRWQIWWPSGPLYKSASTSIRKLLMQDISILQSVVIWSGAPSCWNIELQVTCAMHNVNSSCNNNVRKHFKYFSPYGLPFSTRIPRTSCPLFWILRNMSSKCLTIVGLLALWKEMERKIPYHWTSFVT